MQNLQVDLTPVVAAIAGVLSEPYQAFLSELHAGGRITDAELLRVRDEILKRGENLGELVRQELRKQAGEQL